MADADAISEGAGSRAGRKGIFIGAGLALLLGGVGFFLTWSGLVPVAASGPADAVSPLPDIAFVPLGTVTVSLPRTPPLTVRFTAQLEVSAPYEGEVAALMPRILDVLNGYLRAVDPSRYQETGALLEIRAQLLRRIQVVTGEGRVRDLLVTEFIVQ